MYSTRVVCALGTQNGY